MILQFPKGQLTLIGNGAPLVLRGRLVPLVCLLIVEHRRLVSADDVHALPGWSGMARDSVGKQVARIIDGLAAKGLAIITWRNKTNGWQLAPAVAADLSPETIAAAHQWLTDHGWAQGRRFAALPAAVVAQWALAAGSAVLATTEGRTADGLASLRRAYDLSDHPDLKAIADVLATRIGQRLSPPHAPVKREHAARSVFELALEARRTAAYAIQSESSRWLAQVKELQALLPELAAAGSLTTQAYVHNALALLLRRLGRFEEALGHAAEAAPLAVFSGDLTLMQAVFFNFGNIASDLRRQDPAAVPQGLSIALVEADRAIRKRLGLGMDSAQGELLLAYLAYEEGALAQAQGWLDEAAQIMAVSQVPADAALAARIAGLVQLASGDRGGIDGLQRAIRLFDSIGNSAAATHVRGELDAALGG